MDAILTFGPNPVADRIGKNKRLASAPVVMPDKETRIQIAKDEGDETFESITDLDSINDTAIVGVTFLLAALVSWTAFAYDGIASHQLLSIIYIFLTVACAVTTATSVYYLTKALSPRGFYGEDVGESFLNYEWLLWRNDDPVDTSTFERTPTKNADQLTNEVDELINQYEHSMSVDSYDDYIYARLLNYKHVARIKAHYTAYAMMLFRIAIVLLVLLIIMGLVGPMIV